MTIGDGGEGSGLVDDTGDDAGKQFQIGIGNRCAGGGGNANQFESLLIGDTGSGQTVFLLEAFDCFGGLGAVIAGDFAGEVTPGFESGLYFADLLSTGAVLG